MRLKQIVLIIVLLISTQWVSAQLYDAVVPQENFGLRLRAEPVDGEVIGYLEGLEPLKILNRTGDNTWVQVQRISYSGTGWVSAQYLQVNIDLNNISVLGTTPVMDTVPPPTTNTNQPSPVGSSGNTGRITEYLRFRTSASTNSTIISLLEPNTHVTILGNSSDGLWLNIQTPDGTTGWVYGEFVEVSTTVVDNNQGGDVIVAEPPPPPLPISFDGVITNITGEAHQIFQTGLALGNQPNVFSKIGDSITVARYSLYPIGNYVYNLGPYEHLQPVVTHYLGGVARDANPFAYRSLAAEIGWSTAHMFDLDFANAWWCEEDEPAFACELRVTKPSVAIIQLGTNDVTWLTSATYYNNLKTIVRIAKEKGVIPVLCTLPPRVDNNLGINEFNRLIRTVAFEESVPLCLVGDWLAALPNQGLGPDGVHLSISSRGYNNSAVFTEGNLSTGYVVRNLALLHVLDGIWQQVIRPVTG